MCCFADGCGLDRWGSPSPSLEGFFCKLRLHHCPGRLTTPSVHGAPGGVRCHVHKPLPVGEDATKWGPGEPGPLPLPASEGGVAAPRVESQSRSVQMPHTQAGTRAVSPTNPALLSRRILGAFSPFPCSYKTDDPMPGLSMISTTKLGACLSSSLHNCCSKEQEARGNILGSGIILHNGQGGGCWSQGSFGTGEAARSKLALKQKLPCLLPRERASS